MQLNSKIALIVALFLGVITLYGIQSLTNHTRTFEGLTAEISTLNLTYMNIDNEYNYYGELSLHNKGQYNITLTNLNISLQAFDNIVNTSIRIPGEINLNPGESKNIDLTDTSTPETTL